MPLGRRGVEVERPAHRASRPAGSCPGRRARWPSTLALRLPTIVCTRRLMHGRARAPSAMRTRTVRRSPTLTSESSLTRGDLQAVGRGGRRGRRPRPELREVLGRTRVAPRNLPRNGPRVGVDAGPRSPRPRCRPAPARYVDARELRVLAVERHGGSDREEHHQAGHGQRARQPEAEGRSTTASGSISRPETSHTASTVTSA